MLNHPMLVTDDGLVDPAKPYHLVTFIEDGELVFVESFTTTAKAVANWQADKATSVGTAWVLAEIHDGTIAEVAEWALEQIDECAQTNPGAITFGPLGDPR